MRTDPSKFFTSFAIVGAHCIYASSYKRERGHGHFHFRVAEVSQPLACIRCASDDLIFVRSRTRVYFGNYSGREPRDGPACGVLATDTAARLSLSATQIALRRIAQARQISPVLVFRRHREIACIPIGKLVKAAVGQGKALTLLIGVRCGIYPFSAARLTLARDARRAGRRV